MNGRYASRMSDTAWCAEDGPVTPAGSGTERAAMGEINR